MGRLPVNQRAFFYHGSLVFFLGAAVVLAAAGFLPGAAVDTPPIRITAGQTIALPDLSFRADSVYLIGNPPTEDFHTTAADLGCTVTQPSPAGPARIFDDPTMTGATINGQKLYSLLQIGDYAAGSRLTCSGPKIAASRPIYLIGAATGLGLRLFFGFVALLALGLGLGTRLAFRKPRS